MILTDILWTEPSIQWTYAKQMGIDHGVIRLPEDPAFDVTDVSHWRTMYERFQGAGIKPIVIEPIPNRLHNSIKLGAPDRDACIAQVIGMLPIMDALNIRTICFNFMAHFGWLRTANRIVERGGALVTGFDIRDFHPQGEPEITEAMLWENLRYFLQAVMPYADRYHIRFALHPDDPPVPKLGKVSRILISRENITKAVQLVNSPHLGVTMCQANYAAMGEDIFAAIRHFSAMGKLFFVHFRDILGEKYAFRETFHDNGQTNMAKAIACYLDCGYEGPVRVDHVPTMAGENNDQPGYDTLGRLFAVGYLKGLLDACQEARGTIK